MQSMVESVTAMQSEVELMRASSKRVVTLPRQNHLQTHCLKLEKYCRELIHLNEVLDFENKLAVARLQAALPPQALSDFISSLRTASRSKSPVAKLAHPSTLKASQSQSEMHSFPGLIKPKRF